MNETVAVILLIIVILTHTLYVTKHIIKNLKDISKYKNKLRDFSF